MDTVINIVSEEQKNKVVWDELNNQVLRDWKTSLSQYIFIYQYILDKYKNKFDRITFAMQTLAEVSVLLAIISTTLMTTDYATPTNVTQANKLKTSFTPVNIISISLTLFIGFINFISVVLGKYIKIYNMDIIIASYSAYIANMDQLCSTVAATLMLQPSSRGNAYDFIENMNIAYLDLIKKSPNIEISEQEEAMKQYGKYIEGKLVNYAYAQKYSKNDSNVSII